MSDVFSVERETVAVEGGFRYGRRVWATAGTVDVSRVMHMVLDGRIKALPTEHLKPTDGWID